MRDPYGRPYTMPRPDLPRMGRRGFITAAAATAAAATAGAATVTPASAQQGGDPGSPGDIETWFADVSNYDGTPADRTGEETVTVAVGAGNGLLFDQPAVRVSPGTTVIWEWTGRGGQHNVEADTGAFESELASAEGTTFEWTFDDSGVVPYFCEPHQAVGMKGVVDVVDG